LAIGEAGKAKPLATFPLGIESAAASPQSQVVLCLHWLIVIWYGEEPRE